MITLGASPDRLAVVGKDRADVCRVRPVRIGVDSGEELRILGDSIKLPTEVNFEVAAECPALAVDTVASVPATVLAALDTTIAVPVRLFAAGGQVVADVNQHMAFSILRVFVFHYTSVHAGAHLGHHTVLHRGFVVSNLCHVMLRSRLHVCNVVQQIHAFKGRKRHLGNQAICWRTTCAADMKHGDARHVAFGRVAGISLVVGVPSCRVDADFDSAEWQGGPGEDIASLIGRAGSWAFGSKEGVDVLSEVLIHLRGGSRCPSN